MQKEIIQNELNKVNLLKNALIKLFSKTEKIYFSSNELDEIFITLFNSKPTADEKEYKFIGLIAQIPEVMVLTYKEDGYFLILKKNIQLPEYLGEILAEEDIIINHFELIKQHTILDDQIKEISKKNEFKIQWIITDSNKKYWTILKNNVFEYGGGIIKDPSIIVSIIEDKALTFFYHGRTILPELDIKGKRYQIVLFAQICERVFFTVKHPLGHGIIERLLATGYFKKENEREEEHKREQQLKLEEEERETKRKQVIIEKLEKEKKLREREMVYNNIISYFEDLTKIYDEIKIKELQKKLPQEIQENFSVIFDKSFIALIEEMIMNKDINARIRSESLTFITGDENSKPDRLKEIISSEDVKEIIVLRGGDWKIEENQSVFYFKVKVKNNSKFVITNIQIVLTSIPTGLISKSDNYKIDALNPKTFESPTFKFTAKDSCVGDFIKGIVLFTDHMGNQQTFNINPFRIEYVCNLLVPKLITEEDYEKNTAIMEEKKIVFDCNLAPDKLESEITEILEHNNFYILKNPQGLTSSDFRKFKAYAEGKYDKQDVALSIIMQKLTDQADKLIIKAMSNKEEKIIDLLKDISIKCSSLKSSSEDSMQLEIICKNCSCIIKLADYMKLKDTVVCEACGEDIEIPKY